LPRIRSKKAAVRRAVGVRQLRAETFPSCPINPAYRAAAFAMRRSSGTLWSAKRPRRRWGSRASELHKLRLVDPFQCRQRGCQPQEPRFEHFHFVGALEVQDALRGNGDQTLGLLCHEREQLPP